MSSVLAVVARMGVRRGRGLQVGGGTLTNLNQSLFPRNPSRLFSVRSQAAVPSTPRFTKSLGRDMVESAFVAGSIGVAGDLLVQWLEQWQKHGSPRFSSFEADWPRAYRMLAFRFLIFGPTYSVWLRFLEKRINTMVSKAAAPVVKTAMDQFVWAPPLIAFYYVCMGVLEGPLAPPVWLGGRGVDKLGEDKRSESETAGHGKAKAGWSEALSSGWERAEEMTLPTLAVGMPFWACFGFINFKFVPLQHRMLFVSVIQIAWNAYMSNINEVARQRQDGEGETAALTAS